MFEVQPAEYRIIILEALAQRCLLCSAYSGVLLSPRDCTHCLTKHCAGLLDFGSLATSAQSVVPQMALAAFRIAAAGHLQHVVTTLAQEMTPGLAA
eukprot:329338-Amphidinium_carterae.1